MCSMKRDRRPVREQIRSGFVIASKILAAFAIAMTFMAGAEMIRVSTDWRHTTLGFLLIILSIAVVTTTVKFWAGGFFGFVAYGAVRASGGVLVPRAFHISQGYAICLWASVFGMAILSHRFALKKLRISAIDRASLVIAAACMMLAFLSGGNNYRAACVFNLGNIALSISWWADRRSSQGHHRNQPPPAATA